MDFIEITRIWLYSILRDFSPNLMNHHKKKIKKKFWANWKNFSFMTKISIIKNLLISVKLQFKLRTTMIILNQNLIKPSLTSIILLLMRMPILTNSTKSKTMLLVEQIQQKCLDITFYLISNKHSIEEISTIGEIRLLISV